MTPGPVGSSSISAPASGYAARGAAFTGRRRPHAHRLQGPDQGHGVRLRTDDGQDYDFTIGILENGDQFPPGHLAEHLATSSPVRVFFRDEGGNLVVYRLEDTPLAP